MPALIAALDDVEPLVRSHVAWALGEMGTVPAGDALQRRLEFEGDDAVRSEIVAAIAQLQGETLL
jgi:HEAT repeat protein